MLTLDEARCALGVSDLDADDTGRIGFKRGLSITARKRELKIAFRVYRRNDVALRFILGNMVNDLFLPQRQKKAYCIQAYGDQAGFTIYSYCLTAAQWQGIGQHRILPWSLYKDAGLLPDDLKECVSSKFISKEWSLSKCREFCANWKVENPRFSSPGTGNDLKTGQKSSSLLVSLPINNRELLQAQKTVRYAPTRQDAIEFRRLAEQRVMDFEDQVELEAAECEEVEEEEDDFADSSYWDAQG